MFKKGKNTDIDMESRKAILWMHPQTVLNLMTANRWVVTENHLPADVKYHHVFFDPTRQIWGVVVQSSTFKSLKLGEQMPELPQVVFKGWTPEDGAI